MLRAWYEDKIIGACSQCKGIPIIWIEQLWIIEKTCNVIACMIKIAGSSVESRPLPFNVVLQRRGERKREMNKNKKWAEREIRTREGEREIGVS